MNSQAYRGNSGPLRARNLCQAVPMVRASGRRGRGVRGGIAEAFPAALNFLFLGFPEKKVGCVRHRVVSEKKILASPEFKKLPLGNRMVSFLGLLFKKNGLLWANNYLMGIWDVCEINKPMCFIQKIDMNRALKWLRRENCFTALQNCNAPL